MLINKNIRIIASNVILVPYREQHVEKYHKWMQSKELQELTASEPLTLEEEYEMQKSWLLDDNKCTFIILDKKTYETSGSEIESMIGDTNLFFPNQDDTSLAEAEIMIAEKWARGRHCGWEAILLMIFFGITYLKVKHYIAKIGVTNTTSIRLFEKLGFIQTSCSNVFNEVTYEKLVNDEWISWIKDNIGEFEIEHNYL